MKTKIIFLAVCLVLLLIFTSSSYGGPDPKYRLKADPWSEMDRCTSLDSTATIQLEATNSKYINISVIRIFWIDITLTKGINSVSNPYTTFSKPSVFKGK